MDDKELMGLLLKRRCIRKYTGEKIDDEKILKVLKAGLCAPSSKNKKPWEFIVVRDKEMLKELSTSKSAFGTFVAGADAAIVVAADKELTDIWEADGAIAAIQMMLMAETLGLGCCWSHCSRRTMADGYDTEQRIRDLLDIPASKGILCILALGIPEKRYNPHTEEHLPLEKIHYEKY